jgi:hypothetical protein
LSVCVYGFNMFCMVFFFNFECNFYMCVFKELR